MRKKELIVRVSPSESQRVADRAAAAGQSQAVWLRARALKLAKLCESWSPQRLQQLLSPATGIRELRSRTLRMRVTQDEAIALDNGRQVLELRLRTVNPDAHISLSDLLRIAARH